MKKLNRYITQVGLFLLVFSINASAREFNIYLEVDLSNKPEIAHSMQKGIELALEQNKNPKHQFNLIVLDNHGNVKQSLLNLQKINKDEKALVVFAGTDSTVLMKNKDFINHNQLLTLVTNATAASITRTKDENWIFRLGLDDARVGYKLIDYAIKNKKCIAPHFFVQDSLWGDQNLRTLSKAITHHGTNPRGITRFDIGIRESLAKRLLLNVIDTSDCVILIAAADESAEIAKAMSSLYTDQRLPIISHESVITGQYPKLVTKDIRKKIDLSFIQAYFSSDTQNFDSMTKSVLKQVSAFEQESNIKLQPSSLAQTFDLTLIFLQAFNEIAVQEDMIANRQKIKDKLENLSTPVKGLIQTYFEPFSPYSEENPFGHEGLSTDYYGMGQFSDDDEIKVIEE